MRLLLHAAFAALGYYFDCCLQIFGSKGGSNEVRFRIILPQPHTHRRLAFAGFAAAQRGREAAISSRQHRHLQREVPVDCFGATGSQVHMQVELQRPLPHLMTPHFSDVIAIRGPKDVATSPPPSRRWSIASARIEQRGGEWCVQRNRNIMWYHVWSLT